MTAPIPLLSTVALAAASAAHGLRRGDAVTVVEGAPGVYDVEVRDDGRSVAMVALRADRLHVAQADAA